MRQTTLRLTDELDVAIEDEASRAGISKGELMRHGIVHYLAWIAAIREHGHTSLGRVWVPDEILERIDRARGDTPRHQWIERAVLAALPDD